jgi:acetoin utilization deacetylase AcuC-like enzyme
VNEWSRREFLEKTAAAGGALFLANCVGIGAVKAEEAQEVREEPNVVEKPDVEKDSFPDKTWIVSHPDCQKHETGPTHPERPARTATLLKALRDEAAPKNLHFTEAREATEAEILTIHAADYVAQAKAVSARGGRLDGDTPVMKDSWRAALLAAGGALAAVDAVAQRRAKNAFVVVRPPGHHALPDRGMGFCVFNNIALAAVRALRQKGVERVLIVDWDLHHGNGTQKAFWSDGRVLFFSSHAHPFYPNSGTETEIGEGRGKDLIVNAPLAVGAGDKEIMEAFEKKLLPAVERVKPQFVLISAGFDAHRLDPMRGLQVTTDCFAKLTAMVAAWAAQYASGRLVSVLEGGYSLDGLREGGLAHVKELVAASTTK